MWFLQPGPAPWLGLLELSAAGTELVGHLQEEVLHDVVVVGQAAVREEAGSKDDNGVETFTIVPWAEAASERPQAEMHRTLSELQTLSISAPNLSLPW